MGLLWDVASIPGGAEVGSSYDPVDDQLKIVHRQDVQPIIDNNKKLLLDGTGGYGPTREWRRVASIPNILLEKWYKEEGIRWWDSDDMPKLAAKLDDPEYAYLRTAPGHVGRRPHRIYSRASTGSVA